MAARAISRNCLHLSHPPPAARAFLNLIAQSSQQQQRNLSIPTAQTQTQSQAAEAPLEFLVPSSAYNSSALSSQASHPHISASRTAAPQTSAFAAGRRHAAVGDSALPHARRGGWLAGRPVAARSFSTGAARRHAAAIVNPRKDEDGVEMSVEITPRAANRLSEIMAQDANPNLALRIQVESGGCHGFQYLMSLTTLPSLPSPAGTAAVEDSKSGTTSETGKGAEGGVVAAATKGIDEDDTVFQALDNSGAKVVMDGPSLELLKGSKVDYTMELIGSQFKIVDNPLATSSCGCGTSFDIKA